MIRRSKAKVTVNKISDVQFPTWRRTLHFWFVRRGYLRNLRMWSNQIWPLSILTARTAVSYHSIPINTSLSIMKLTSFRFCSTKCTGALPNSTEQPIHGNQPEYMGGSLLSTFFLCPLRKKIIKSNVSTVIKSPVMKKACKLSVAVSPTMFDCVQCSR